MRRNGISTPIITVRDGEEAIAYLKREGQFSDVSQYPDPSIVFLDLKMPKVDGFEVLRWMKSQPGMEKILRIILTHSAEVRDVNQAYELGIHSFLTKPFEYAELKNLTTHFGDCI